MGTAVLVVVLQQEEAGLLQGVVEVIEVADLLYSAL